MSKRTDLPSQEVQSKRSRVVAPASSGIASKAQIDAAKRQRELARLGASYEFITAGEEYFQEKADDSSDGGDMKEAVESSEEVGEEHGRT